MRAKSIAAILVLAGAVASASAADLKVGLSAVVTSMDPQFYVIGPNSAMARNIFDGLVNQDANQRVQPALAESWRTVDDVTWEFKLRKGVKFHDGSEFDAADVVASLRRVPAAAVGSPSSFLLYVKGIKDVQAVDPATVRIVTEGPLPLLANNLSRIAILPSEVETFSSKTLDSGKGVIGTGPYKFVEWQPDSHVTLARNEAYWGAKPEWAGVTFRFITNARTRVASLLAGDVDMIEEVPSQDLGTVRTSGRATLVNAVSNRVMYLHMDQFRAESPFSAAANGKNPMVDVRVRRALSMAINREALVDRIMEGEGIPTGQLVPEGYFGYVPGLKPVPFSVDGAKKLLAEAGYGDGFKLTFHASNDRYPNDAKIAQAIGQMFTRIGVATEVVTMPGAVYFPRASKLEFSLIMGGAAVETGEASGVLGPLLATFGPNKGAGNRGRYSSPAFDAAFDAALKTVDDAKREELLQQAMRVGMEDVGVIPLFFMVKNWGLRNGLTMKARTDGYTLAELIAGR